MTTGNVATTLESTRLSISMKRSRSRRQSRQPCDEVAQYADRPVGAGDDLRQPPTRPCDRGRHTCGLLILWLDCQVLGWIESLWLDWRDSKNRGISRDSHKREGSTPTVGRLWANR